MSRKFTVNFWDEGGTIAFSYETPEDFEPVETVEELDDQSPAEQALYNVIGLMRTLQEMADMDYRILGGFVEEGDPATDELQMLFYMMTEDDDTLH